MATSKFIMKVEKALEELVTLKIVTAVGEMEVDVNEGRRASVTALSKSKVIWTSIDLLQGDILTVIHPDYEGEAGKELREFHKARETQGIAIIKENVAALRDLVKLLAESYESRKARPADLPSGDGANPAKPNG
jgi:hypothetical protein